MTVNEAWNAAAEAAIAAEKAKAAYENAVIAAEEAGRTARDMTEA